MKSISKKVFKYRSYTPLPFLVLMLIFARPTLTSLIIGFVISAIGESIRLWGVSYAGSETRTTGEVGGTFLVVSGAFAHVRNPLYLGNILLYTGVGISSYALFPYLQIVAFFFFLFQYLLIVIAEEEYLSKTFGEQYEHYRRNVPSIIPRLTAYRNPGIVQPPLNIKAGLKSEKRSLQAFASITIILVLIYLLNGR